MAAFLAKRLRNFRTIPVLLAVVSSATPIATYAETSDSFEDCLKAPHDVLVRLEMEFGEIDVELFGARAPITACNFLRYVKAGLFDGGRFFRTVRPDNQGNQLVKISVVQADILDGTAPHFPPIPMESTVKTGIHHIDGTISMARGTPNDASSSFFISLGEQPDLDFGGKRNSDGQGFAAFGRVIRGLDLVKRIWLAPTSGEELNPPIIIRRARIVQKSQRPA